MGWDGRILANEGNFLLPLLSIRSGEFSASSTVVTLGL
jgi:hypothetical protein